MNNIPFPNPHDADALNSFLDDLAAGKQLTPGDEVQGAAQAFHELASTGVPPIPARTPVTAQGGDPMNTTAYSTPISNRTRQARNQTTSPTRSETWLSGLLVAGLLLTMVGYAWWNGPGGSDESDLAWAPGTVTPMESAQEPLNPETSPWMADFQVEDCKLAADTNYELVTAEAIEGTPQGYSITGPASSEDAEAVVSTYRDMRGCRNMGGAFNYWSHARINNFPRVFNDQNRKELTELEDYFRTVYPQQFMSIGTDLRVDSRTQEEWNLREDHDIIGLPLALEAKLNPAWGVELSDGRVAFPATVLYSESDPAIIANGLPVDWPESTVAMIFAFEDGAWKYDDSLQLCLVNCDYGVGTPANPDEHTWLRSADPAQCTTIPISGDEYRERLATLPDFDGLSYIVAGDAPLAEATDAASVAQSLLDCGLEPEQFQTEAHLTDLGLFTYRFMTQNSTPRDARVAEYFRQSDLGTRDLLLFLGTREQMAVVNGPVISYMPGEFIFEITPVRTDSQNVASTNSSEFTYNPASAFELEDGRILLIPTSLISIDSRAAVTYEGDTSTWFSGWRIMKETESGWLIDEMLYVSPDNLVMEESYQWWWESQYDPTPVATPAASPEQ